MMTKDGDEIVTLRANFEASGNDWAKFRTLCKNHGFTVHQVFTRMFNQSIELMEDNRPLWDKLEDLSL